MSRRCRDRLCPNKLIKKIGGLKKSLKDLQAPFLLDNSYLPKETNETKIMEKYLSDTYQVLDDLSSMTPYGGVRTPSEVCT